MLMRMTLTYFITAHAATVAVPLAALPDLRRLVVIRPEECLTATFWISNCVSGERYHAFTRPRFMRFSIG